MIQSKSDYQYYIEEDRKYYFGKQKPNKWREVFFPDLVWRFQKALRRYEYANNVKHGIFGRILTLFAYYKYRKLSIKLGFLIPKNVCGPGLSIAHYGPVLIHSSSKIGKNCRIHVGVSVSASAGSSKGPILGDNVYIGTGAIIFGDITIANNVMIGANATVNKSVETENCVIAGTPARIVKENVGLWHENRR